MMPNRLAMSDHVMQPLHQQARRHCRRRQQRQHQRDAYRLQAGDYRHRDQYQEQGAQAFHRQPQTVRQAKIKIDDL